MGEINKFKYLVDNFDCIFFPSNSTVTKPDHGEVPVPHDVPDVVLVAHFTRVRLTANKKNNTIIDALILINYTKSYLRSSMV